MMFMNILFQKKILLIHFVTLRKQSIKNFPDIDLKGIKLLMYDSSIVLLER